MSPGRSTYSPGPSATPGPNDFFSDYSQDTPLQRRPTVTNRPEGVKTSTEPWEVLSDSGASLISPTRQKSDSIRSWKSARNGQKLDEFGGMSFLRLGSFVVDVQVRVRWFILEV
jgi:hypothetical protein